MLFARTIHVNSEIGARSLYVETNKTKCSDLKSSGATIAELQIAGCPASSTKSNIYDDLYKIRLTNECQYDIYVAICWHCIYCGKWHCGCWLKVLSQTSEFVKDPDTDRYIFTDYHFAYFYADY